MTDQGPAWLQPGNLLLWIAVLAAFVKFLMMILRCCRRSNRNISHVLQESADYISDVDAKKVAKYTKAQLELAGKRTDIMFKHVKMADLIGKNKNKHLEDMDGMFGKAKSLVEKF